MVPGFLKKKNEEGQNLTSTSHRRIPQEKGKRSIPPPKLNQSSHREHKELQKKNLSDESMPSDGGKKKSVSKQRSTTLVLPIRGRAHCCYGNETASSPKKGLTKQQERGLKKEKGIGRQNITKGS